MAIDLTQLREQVRELNLGWEPGVTVHEGQSMLQARSRLGAEPPGGAAELAARQRGAEERLRRAAIEAPGLPTVVDWRNHGGSYVTGIRDQAGCGSCVAFGAIAVFESAIMIQAGRPGLAVDLSEAQLYFCYGYGHGAGHCPDGGWWPDQAFAGMAAGITDDAHFPYTDADQGCGLRPGWQSTVSSFRSSNTVSSIAAAKTHLANVGPMSACFTVYEDFYYHYTGGVYTYHPNTSGRVIGGHCVCIVGYDDAQGCWIAKNSWGPGWGETGYFRISYGSAGIDAEMWGINSAITSPYINLPQHSKATVCPTVVARVPTHLDVFTVDDAGRTVSTWWDNSVGWGRWFQVSGGVASGGGQGSGVTSVSRFPNHLDLFTVGTDNRVYSCWWDNSSGWAAWFPLSGITCRPGSTVNVVSRNTNHLDLFTTAADGRIMSCWWDATSGWSSWFQVGGGVAANGATVTAIARNPNHLDLFTVGTDNRVYSCWWDNSSGWAAWFALPGITARSNSTVNVVARTPNNLDLFTVASNGAIMSTWWNSGGGWGSWFQVSGGVASPGSQVTALARHPGHLDLFVVGTDARIYSTWWDQSSGWAGWFNVSGGISQQGGQVACINRYPEHIDLFTVGTDGLVYSTWWDGASGWAGWFQVT